MPESREQMADRLEELEGEVQEARSFFGRKRLDSQVPGLMRCITDAYDEITTERNSLRAELDRLKRELAAEERSHAATIDTRDCHEERINELGAALGLDETDLTWNLNDVGARAVEAAEKLTSQLAASQAQNAVLREALEKAPGEEVSIRSDGDTYCLSEECCQGNACGETIEEVGHSARCFESIRKAALAATPEASLASVKAGALREAASKLEAKFGTIISCGDLLDMADQFEAAAKGEKDA